ncbi:uncharacterized protein LOC142538489 [Primulina tabacum]|uniref:uncharacterized protein LOC142538489 n=1 Tax=Primulina tabacum TaxID=48773 RepID=UPI003F5A3227
MRAAVSNSVGKGNLQFNDVRHQIFAEEVRRMDSVEGTSSKSALNLENRGRDMSGEKSSNRCRGRSKSRNGKYKNTFEKNLKCWSCGEIGHLKKNCKSTKNNENAVTEEMKVVDYEKHGGPDVLRIKERPKPTGAPFHQYGFREGIGCECSGKVTVVGSDTCEFEEGDEVCASLHFGGAYAEFVVVHERDVLRIPSGVSLVQAAVLPEASRIHDIAGGTDFIAIQYVKHIGCKVFALAGTKKKLRICQRLGAEVCINYRKEDVCKRVKAETGEKGVDIILDVCGRDHFQKNMDCLAKGGSLVISGHEIGSRMDIDLSFLMKKGISIIGADVRSIDLFERRRLWSDVAATLWPLIEDGHIKPIIGKIFSFDEAAEAHRALEEQADIFNI